MQKNIVQPETKEQAIKRLHTALTAEIQAYQQQGLPNEVMAMRIYASFVEARYEIEQLRAAVRRLTEQLGKEIEAIVKTS